MDFSQFRVGDHVTVLEDGLPYIEGHIFEVELGGLKPGCRSIITIVDEAENHIDYAYFDGGADFPAGWQEEIYDPGHSRRFTERKKPFEIRQT